MNKYEIRYLKLENGKSPITIWLNTLDKTTRNRIIQRIQRIEDGNLGDYKKISEDISEIRFNFGSGYRVYYHELNKVILLIINGGDKSTQEKDIIKANNLLKEWRDNNAIQFK